MNNSWIKHGPEHDSRYQSTGLMSEMRVRVLEYVAKDFAQGLIVLVGPMKDFTSKDLRWGPNP